MVLVFLGGVGLRPRQHARLRSALKNRLLPSGPGVVVAGQAAVDSRATIL
jgi:hypothetical protein